MALKNAPVTVIADVNDLNWTDQIQFVNSALFRSIEQLSGIKVEVKSLASRASDKSGRANLIKHLIRVPAGANAAETFTNGSLVGTALISQDLKDAFDAIIKELSGQDSAFLDLDVSLSRALEVQAPGLIEEAPTGGFVEIGLNLVETGTFDKYNIVPRADIAVADTGRVNWSQTPGISEFSGRKLHLSFSRLVGPNGSFVDPVIGEWNYTNTEDFTDTDGPTTSTFISNLKTSPFSGSIKKDTVEVAAVTSSGTYVNATVIISNHGLLLFPGSDLLFMTDSVHDFKNFGFNFVKYFENPPIFETLDSIDKSLEIKNNTVNPILAGTILGQLHILKDSIAEIF